MIEKWLNPLLPFEIRRVTRRGKPYLSRVTYAVGLGVVMGLGYLILMSHGRFTWERYLTQSVVDDPKLLAGINYFFFLTFAALQFMVATFGLGAISAAAIAEEKEKQTLPFLLATPLSDREIILGKALVRIGQVLLVMITVLPFLALAQMFGGVDLRLSATVFLATGITMCSLVSIGAAAGVYAPSVKSANQGYGQLVGSYIGICWVALNVAGPHGYFGGYYFFPILDIYSGDIIEWLCIGSPLTLFSQVKLGSINGSLNYVCGPLFCGYFAFHTATTAAALSWACRNLRSKAAQHADRSATAAPVLVTAASKPDKPRYHPPVSDRPVYWRETYCMLGQKHKHVPAVAITLFVLSFLMVFWIIAQEVVFKRGTPGTAVNIYLRGIATLVLFGGMLQAAGRSGDSIPRERRQNTLDDLLTTSMTTKEILSQKALAAVQTTRWHWLWVGLHWIIGMLCGGVSPLAILFVAPLAVMGYAVAAAVGMFFSVVNQHKPKATSTAGAFLILASLMPFGLVIAVGILEDFKNVEPYWAFCIGLSPPAAMAALTFRLAEWDFFGRQPVLLLLFAAGVATGCAIWCFVGVRLWRSAQHRFRQVTERDV